jgi:hypothetical protein
MAVGMGLVLQVGEPSEMVQAPKGFPKCGNYRPRVFADPPAVAAISPSGDETPPAGETPSGGGASISPMSEVVDEPLASMDESLGRGSVEPFSFTNEVYQPFYENIST